MIYTKIILTAFLILAFIYYVMVVGQLLGAIKVTNRQIKFVNLCIPFYYWIVSQNPKKK